MQKKIIHIAQSLPGGPATYLEGIGSFQVAHYGEHNVRFFILSTQRDHISVIPDNCIIPCQYDQRSLKHLFLFMRQAISAIDSFRPDIVHLHSTFAGAMMRLPYLLFLRRNRPIIVYCSHGWVFCRDDAEWKNRAYAILEKSLAGVTDAIINISHYESKAAISRGLPKNISHTILNGTSGYSLTSPRVESFDSKVINLLFVGRFDRQKGFDILLEAMRSLTDKPVHLYAIGGFVVDCGVVDAVSPDLPPNVTLLGWLPRHEVGGYLAAADALLMPSRWEGFGLTAIEAMSQGTPAIVSNRGALPEIIESGKTGLVVSELEPFVLAETIANLNREQLRRWGLEATKRQQLNFNLERQNKELIELYESITAKDKARK
jgi:glycosyltransferase involved in cell wall biosynthesis